MQPRSVEDQIAALRSVRGLAPHAHKWLLAGAAIGLIAAVAFWHPVPLMIAVFLGLVGFAEQRTGPNLAAALTAYDTGTPSPGEISIAIQSWDSTDRYHATVRAPGQPDWTYEFIPQGWQPTAGTYPARIWRTGPDQRPALAIVEAGILIPRYDPKPAGRAEPSV